MSSAWRPIRTHTLNLDQSSGKKRRRNCVGCYQKLRAMMSRREADNKVTKVPTYCTECNRAMCLKCFNEKHSFFIFPPKFRCPNCPNVYLKKSTLSRHAKYECGKLPRFGCTLCDYRGYQKTHVERHLFTKHKFQTKNEIKRHVYVHSMD
nr:unnamed protein product [Callosobruchus analis]